MADSLVKVGASIERVQIRGSKSEVAKVKKIDEPIGPLHVRANYEETEGRTPSTGIGTLIENDEADQVESEKILIQ